MCTDNSRFFISGILSILILVMRVGQVFGEFLGSIIGGGCTCWAVIKQKQYADEQRKLDEVAEIRPYIVAVSPRDVKFWDRLELHFIIQNIGLNSACDIEIYAINLDWKEPKK